MTTVSNDNLQRMHETPLFFFFNDTATTEIYTLSLHDALPICLGAESLGLVFAVREPAGEPHLEGLAELVVGGLEDGDARRSEEHTSELQSRQYLVCRLLLEKKKSPDRPLLATLKTGWEFTSPR